MYKKWFYITEKIWNNAFSFTERTHPQPLPNKEGSITPKIWVPELIKIDSFDEIKLQSDKEKVAFEDFWFDDKLSTNYGLENFYEIVRPHPNPLLLGEGIEQKIYLFDNHNHALYFWYLAKEKWLISEKNNTLYHIDEHADSRDPDEILEKTDLESIFKYTNFSKINVWNYIVPAEKEWLIWKTIQIRNTKNLEDYLKGQTQDLPLQEKCRGESCVHPNNIILNLDLDFFQPDLDFIDYDLKKKVILDIAKKADIITVSTSPFFIDQNLAIKVFKDLFTNPHLTSPKGEE